MTTSIRKLYSECRGFQQTLISPDIKRVNNSAGTLFSTIKLPLILMQRIITPMSYKKQELSTGTLKFLKVTIFLPIILVSISIIRHTLQYRDHHRRANIKMLKPGSQECKLRSVIKLLSSSTVKGQ